MGEAKSRGFEQSSSRGGSDHLFLSPHHSITPSPTHRPGLELSERLYREAVAPVLARAFPGLAYAAARVGLGSEVLGFDTARSMDHEWGPRLQLFLTREDEATHGAAMVELLRHELPREIGGFPTNFGPTHESGVGAIQAIESGPIAHRVEVTTVAAFLRERLGIESDDNLGVRDWLTFSEQALLEVTAGAVWHDGSGALTAARQALAYYPHDVWLYLLAAQWTRIGQQEPFVGRTGEVGDEVGSATIAAVLVRDAMRLAFLIERRYAPYNKWFGSAFARLDCAPVLLPHLEGALAARDWREREAHLTAVFEHVAAMHNALGITSPLPERATPFHNRPFLVIHGDRFAAAIQAAIADPEVRRLPPGVGSVDQFVDATDVLSHPERRRRLIAVYDDRSR
jgi:hypothetical protein